MERDRNLSAVEDFKCFDDTSAIIQGFASSTFPPDEGDFGVCCKRRLECDVTPGCVQPRTTSRDASTQTDPIRPKVLSTHFEFWSIEPKGSSECMLLDEDNCDDVEVQGSSENMSVDEDDCNDVDVQDSSESSSSDDEGLSDFSDQENNMDNIEVADPDDQKFVYKKNRTFCCFCQVSVSDLSRHLINKHSKEEQVKHLMSLPLRSQERRTSIQNITRQGYRVFHKMNPDSKFIVGKRLATKDSPYVPCPNCKAMYPKGSLQRHNRTCSGALRASKTSIREAASSHNKQSAPIEPSDKSRQTISPSMMDDETLKIIKSSPELIKYGNDLCDRYATKKLYTNLIRTKLRLLGSFLLECKAVDKTILGLTDIFNFSKWDSVFAGLKRICSCDDSGNLESPTTVKAIQTALISLAGDIAVECSSTEDRKKMTNWIKVFDYKVTNTIGYWAKKAIEENRWDKEETGKERTLSVVEDIMKLNMHLADTSSRSVARLKKCFHENTWKLLNEACMVQLLLFNRKRIAEVGTILLTNFRDKKKIDETSDVHKSLVKSEKILCRRCFHMGVKGRLGRAVPVLMEENVAHTVEFLLSLRREAGVAASNPYLFASGSTYFSGLKALNKFTKDCGAENPKQLISRNVRGHLATVTQTLCLNDGERDHLTASLRQDPETNKENITSCVALHTAKLSKILDALNKGVLHEYKGRCLEEIPVDNLLHQEEEEVSKPPNSSIDDLNYFKIAKFLCAVNKGVIHKYAGCTLDEIPASVMLPDGEEELVLPQDITDEPSNSTEPSTSKSPQRPKSPSNSSKTPKFPSNSTEPPISPSKSPRPSMSPSNSSESWSSPLDSSEPPSSPSTSHGIGRRMPTPSKKFKQRWTTPEREIVNSHMKHHLDKKSLPSIPECRKLMAKYPVLKKRTPVTIKAYINNTNNKKN